MYFNRYEPYFDITPRPPESMGLDGIDSFLLCQFCLKISGNDNAPVRRKLTKYAVGSPENHTFQI